jgi:hypothetical protein
MKYEIREEVAEVIANAILYFVLGVFIFIFILIGSIAAALFVGQEVGYGWGFAIVAGCYLVRPVERRIDCPARTSASRADDPPFTGVRPRGFAGATTSSTSEPQASQPAH